MTYNASASLDILTCNDYVDFGKNQNRFGNFSWSKNNSTYLDVKLKERRQQKLSPGPNALVGRGRFKPVDTIEE